MLIEKFEMLILNMAMTILVPKLKIFLFCTKMFSIHKYACQTISLLVDRCVKSVQIRYFWSVFSCIRNEYGLNARKYGPETTPYLDTFQAVGVFDNS